MHQPTFDLADPSAPMLGEICLVCGVQRGQPADHPEEPEVEAEAAVPDDVSGMGPDELSAAVAEGYTPPDPT